MSRKTTTGKFAVHRRTSNREGDIFVVVFEDDNHSFHCEMELSAEAFASGLTGLISGCKATVRHPEDVGKVRERRELSWTLVPVSLYDSKSELEKLLVGVWPEIQNALDVKESDGWRLQGSLGSQRSVSYGSNREVTLHFSAVRFLDPPST